MSVVALTTHSKGRALASAYIYIVAYINVLFECSVLDQKLERKKTEGKRNQSATSEWAKFKKKHVSKVAGRTVNNQGRNPEKGYNVINNELLTMT